MLTPEECVRAAKLQDRLIELYMRRADATTAKDRDLVDVLQAEINEATAQLEEIRNWDIVESA